MFAKFQQKMCSSMLVGARQCIQFLDKIPGFSKTMELCLNFRMAFFFT